MGSMTISWIGESKDIPDYVIPMNYCLIRKNTQPAVRQKVLESTRLLHWMNWCMLLYLTSMVVVNWEVYRRLVCKDSYKLLMMRLLKNNSLAYINSFSMLMIGLIRSSMRLSIALRFSSLFASTRMTKNWFCVGFACKIPTCLFSILCESNANTING